MKKMIVLFGLLCFSSAICQEIIWKFEGRWEGMHSSDQMSCTLTIRPNTPIWLAHFEGKYGSFEQFDYMVNLTPQVKDNMLVFDENFTIDNRSYKMKGWMSGISFQAQWSTNQDTGTFDLKQVSKTKKEK